MPAADRALSLRAAAGMESPLLHLNLNHDHHPTPPQPNTRCSNQLEGSIEKRRDLTEQVSCRDRLPSLTA